MAKTNQEAVAADVAADVAATEAETTVNVVAIEPIQHDATLYQPGDVIAMGEEQAAALVAIGAASLA